MILAKGLKATEAVLEEEDEMADAMLEMDTQEDLESCQIVDPSDVEVDYEDDEEEAEKTMQKSTEEDNEEESEEYLSPKPD